MICSCCVHQSTLFLRTSRPLDRAAFPLPYTEEHAASFLHYDATLTVPINMAIVDTTTASNSIVGGVGLTVAASPLLRTAHRGTLVFWTGMPYAGKGVVRLPETRLTTGRMCVCVGGGGQTRVYLYQMPWHPATVGRDYECEYQHLGSVLITPFNI